MKKLTTFLLLFANLFICYAQETASAQKDVCDLYYESGEFMRISEYKNGKPFDKLRDRHLKIVPV